MRGRSGNRLENNTSCQTIIFEGDEYVPFKFYMKLDDAEFWYCHHINREQDIQILDINDSSHTSKNEVNENE